MNDSWFFSCDWGTTSFRLRLVRLSAKLEIVSEFSSLRGVRSFAGASPEAFEAYLNEAIDGIVLPPDLFGAAIPPVLISGMASSSIGWREVPYAKVPFRVTTPDDLKWEKLDVARGDESFPVYLLAGVRTETDIMRGEESELVGLFSNPDPNSEWRELAGERCTVILPGTHSKHVFIENGAITEFTTYMTGELFETLANHSILGNSVAWKSATDRRQESLSGDALRCFDEGLDAAGNTGLAPNLFKVRTRTVMGGVDPGANTWFLLGLLLGAELATLAERPDSAPVLLAAGPAFAFTYRRGLESLLRDPGAIRVVRPEALRQSVVTAHAALLGQI